MIKQKEIIPARLTSLPNWVLWRLEKSKGKRNTKIPYQVNGRRASSTNPETWSDFATILTAYEEKREYYSGIGFVFPHNSQIVGVDIDKFITPDKNDDGYTINNPTLKKFIESARTYIEFSPSKTGVHLYFFVHQGFKVKANRSLLNPHFEVYSSNRYFTVTGDIFPKSEKEIREVTEEELDELLSIVGYPWNDSDNQLKYVPYLKNIDVLNRMFNANPKSKKLYNGDISDYPSYSEADMAFCSYLAYWTGGFKDQIESIWLNSPLGQRDKTQKRKKYREDTINRAISNLTETYPQRVANIVSDIKKSPEGQDITQKPEYQKVFSVLDITQEGKVRSTIKNLVSIFYEDPFLSKGFRLNELSGEVETNLTVNDHTNKKSFLFDDEWKSITDEIYTVVQTYIVTTYPFSSDSVVSISNIRTRIIDLASRKKIHPVRKYIKELKWDGVPRIDTWLHKTFNVPDSKQYRAMGRVYMLGIINRIFRPGCKFDNCLVLQGEQGLYKSTCINILALGYHVEYSSHFDIKSIISDSKGKIIVEFSEGCVISKAEQAALKSFITREVDVYRKPYDRNSISVPRSFVFASTTNDPEFLTDPTGNRRYFVVDIGNKKANIDWLKENVEQMYAEAYVRGIVNNESTVLNDEELELIELITDLQESATVEDPLLFDINLFLAALPHDKLEEGLSTINVIKNVQDTTNVTMSAIKRAAVIFRKLGFEKKKIKVSSLSSLWRWYPTDETKKQLDVVRSHFPKEVEKIRQKIEINDNWLDSFPKT